MAMGLLQTTAELTTAWGCGIVFEVLEVTVLIILECTCCFSNITDAPYRNIICCCRLRKGIKYCSRQLVATAVMLLCITRSCAVFVECKS